jgi:hypothetical protein
MHPKSGAFWDRFRGHLRAIKGAVLTQHIDFGVAGRKSRASTYPAIEKLPARPPGKRWSPDEAIPRALLGKRKAERQARWLEQVIDPIAYDVKRPIVEVEEPVAPSGGFLASLARALTRRPAKEPVLEGNILPPASSAFRQPLRR